MRLAVIVVGCALSACAALPRSGPSVSEIEAQAEAETPLAPFALIELTPGVAEALSTRDSTFDIGALFDDRPAVGEPLATGDVVSVTLFEATGGGLLGGGEVGQGGAARQLPPQTIDPRGRIRVPYAGEVAVAGLEPDAAAQRIEAALIGQSIEPQALVAVQGSPRRSVTVLGDAVSGGARVPLSAAGDRLLDAVATAGGFSRPLHETSVRLTRQGAAVEVQADELLRNPGGNVALRPGDVIAVEHRPRTFVALGAVGAPSRVPIDKADMRLADAIAMSRGLLDDRADPAGVFLIRFEERAELARLGAVAALEIERLPQDAPPVIYRLDLTQATGLLSARRTPVRDGDILFVANAPITPVEKVLRIVGLSLPSVSTGLLAANTF